MSNFNKHDPLPIHQVVTSHIELDQAIERDEVREGNDLVKSLVERRRKNDVVRHRELNQLREIQRTKTNESSKSTYSDEINVIDLDDISQNNEAIKKINAIEAELSGDGWGNSVQSKIAQVNTDDAGFGTNNGDETKMEQGAIIPSKELVIVQKSENVQINGSFALPMLCDIDIEQAALYFVRGNDLACEKVLRDSLIVFEKEEVKINIRLACLVDLYCALGWREKFDELAASYSKQYADGFFSWRSMLNQQPNEDTSPFVWHAPTNIDGAAVLRLSICTTESVKYNKVLVIDCVNLQTIRSEALPLLAAWIRCLCDSRVAFQFRSIANLHESLGKLGADKLIMIEPQFWLFQLDLARCLNQSDNFDLISVGYAAQLKLPKPRWISPVATASYESLPIDRDLANEHLIFSGAVIDDIAENLKKYQGTHKAVTVQCSDWIRVDFAAIGCLLDWIEQLRQDRRSVQFVNVPRLIAAVLLAIDTSRMIVMSIRPLT
jgi:ABC-type transporter Mla MlaB component